MTSKRLFIVLMAITGLLLVGMVAGAYGISSLLGSQSTKLVSLKAKSQALDQEQLSLAKAKKEVQKYSGLNTIAETVVPQDKSQAEAVRELVNIAAAHGVILGSITFPTSTLGATSTETANGSASSATISTHAAIATESNPKSSTNKLSQLQPVPNIPGVYDLSITVQSGNSVPYNQFISFLSGLEQNRRTSQVTSITITPDPTDASKIDFVLALNEYIKP